MAEWFIYDITTGTQDPVDPSQLELTIKKIPTNQIENIHVWCEGMPDWQPLKAVRELMAMRAVRPPPPPPRLPSAKPSPPPLSVVPEAVPVTPSPASVPMAAAPTVVQAEVIPLVKQASEERRKTARQQARFRVIIIDAKVVHRSFSKDLSDGGFRLEKALSAPVQSETVECYISSGTMRDTVHIRARAIDDNGKRTRFEFVEVDEKSLSILKAWIHAKAA